MKKIILILFTLVFFTGITSAQKVRRNDAEQIAKEIFRRNNNGKTTKLKAIIPLGNEDKNDTLLYIVPYEKSGFSIVSGNYAAPPSLGYCSKGVYDPSLMPPGLLYLIEKYKYEINKLKKEKKKPTKKIKQLWEEYFSGYQLKSATDVELVFDTKWDQYSSFNDSCPENCPAGCTAIAMAQILRYWECRVNPTGSVTYGGSGYYGGSANFGSTTYDWQGMHNTIAEPDNQLLVYHAGVSCLTEYNTDSSSSSIHKALDGFEDFWGMSTNADIKWRISHLSTWKSDLKNELNWGRPIYYRGSNLTLTHGHGWVIHGYNDNDQFICNWGWGGSYDGPYSLGGFDPPGDLGPYNQYEGAIFSLYPAQSSGVATPDLSNQTFTHSSNGYNLTIPETFGATSYEWITNKGTISRSGTSVTLYTDESATVQVRAYNDICEIYSPYKSATITINYGSISSPDLICYSNYTASIQNVPNTTITWGGANVAYPNGNTGTSVTVRAASSSTANSGTITASFTVDGTPYTISKTVWVGAPRISNITGPMNTPNGQWATYHAIPESDFSSPTDYNWILNPLNGNSVYDYGDDVDIAFYNSGSYQLIVQALNTCSDLNFGPYYGTSLYVYDSRSLLISPNPTTGETTLTIESGAETLKSAQVGEGPFDDNAEWDVEIYSPMQALKTKKIKLKGKSTTIQTAGWTEGVYTVRVKYKDEILTGKLIVKR